MDPDANLKEQREIVKDLIDGNDYDTDEWLAMANRLADLVEALDGWLSNGGFLPLAWRQGGAR